MAATHNVFVYESNGGKTYFLIDKDLSSKEVIKSVAGSNSQYLKSGRFPYYSFLATKCRKGTDAEFNEYKTMLDKNCSSYKKECLKHLI